MAEEKVKTFEDPGEESIDLSDISANLAVSNYKKIMEKLENGETEFANETKAMEAAIRMTVEMTKSDFEQEKLEFEKAKLEFEKAKLEFEKSKEDSRLEFEKSKEDSRFDFEQDKLEFEKSKFDFERNRQEKFDERELDKLILENRYRQVQINSMNNDIKMSKADMVKDGVKIGISVVAPIATFIGGLGAAFLMHKAKSRSQMDFMKLNAVMQENGIVTGISNSRLIESQFNDLMKRNDNLM